MIDQQLVSALHASVDIRDRRHRLKLYRSVFLGDAMVAALMELKQLTCQQALTLGNRLIREHVFHHVYDDHLLEDSSQLFYRFYTDEKSPPPEGDETDRREAGVVKAKVDTGTASFSSSTHTTQQQLTSMRLHVAGKFAEAEAAQMDMQRRFTSQLQEHEQTIRTLIFVVAILSLMIAVLSTWQPLVPGWVGYTIVVVCVGYGLNTIKTSIHTMASRHGVSVWTRLMSGSTKENNGNNRTNRNNDTTNTTNTTNSPTAISTPTPTSTKLNSTLKRLPPTSEWPQHPVLVQMLLPLPSSVPTYQTVLANDITTVYTIDNDYFSGRMIILIKNISNNTTNTTQTKVLKHFFQGRKRVTANYVQGHFKKNFKFFEILTGQTFSQPLANLPASFLIKTGLAFLKGIAPGLRTDVLGDSPYLLTPLIAAAQTVHVAKSMEEAPSLRSIVNGTMNDQEIENTTLLGGSMFREMNMNSSKRRKHFKNMNDNPPFHSASTTNNTPMMNTTNDTNTFDKNLVYTFGFWQDLFDPADYCAHLPFGSFDLSRYMNRQPMCIKTQIGIDGPLLWNVKLWHKKLLPVPSEEGGGGGI